MKEKTKKEKTQTIDVTKKGNLVGEEIRTSRRRKAN